MRKNPQNLRWRPLEFEKPFLSHKNVVTLKLIKFNFSYFFSFFIFFHNSRVFNAVDSLFFFFIKQNNDNRSKCNSCFQYFYNCSSVDWKAVVNLELTSMSSLLRILKVIREDGEIEFRCCRSGREALQALRASIAYLHN